MHFQLKLNGTFSIEELEKLTAIKDVACLCHSLENSELGDLCDRIYDIVLERIELIEEYNYDGYDDYDTVVVDEPEKLAASCRSYFKNCEKNQITVVGQAMIKKGTLSGHYTILKNSTIPVPFASLPSGIRKIYNKLKQDGLIDDYGTLLKNVEVASRNQAVGLALGYSANANKYLPATMPWAEDCF